MTSSRVRPPLVDQVADLQRKIQLLEGDRDAHYESSRCVIERNSASIRRLRQDNRRLHRELAEAEDGDERTVRAALHTRALEKHGLRNRSEEKVLGTLQDKSLSQSKQLNALRHATRTQRRHLEDLTAQYKRQKSEAGTVCPRDAAEDHATERRTLENKLEKTQLKCKESENVTANYLKIKSLLQDESLTFQGRLDGLNQEILKHRGELQSMQLIYRNAKADKEDYKAELQQVEEQLHRDRKERERVMASYRRDFERCKAEAERNERRAQRTAMPPDEASSEAQRSAGRTAAGEEKATSSFEEIYRSVREATGTAGVQEVVERFTSQKDTHQHLEEVQQENEEVLRRLKEQKKLLRRQLDDTKYSGEAKLCSERRTLEERERRLREQLQKRGPAEERLDWLTGTLGAARAGVEHLADKLQHVSVSDEAGESAVELTELAELAGLTGLMGLCQRKLRAMQAELRDTDVAAVMKEMEEEAFLVKMEGKLPECNTRIKLPGEQTQELFEDEDEREDDEAGVVSRDALKRQSQLIVDTNPKKKTWKKKKGNV